MEPEEHPFHPDEVDEQIDRSSDQDIIQPLHALYAAEAEEMDRVLARGRARLEQSQASLAAQQEPNPAGHLSLVPPERQTITELTPRLPQRYRRWPLRLGSLVAAALLVALVGSLVAGLVLVRHNKTGTVGDVKATTQASATPTKDPAQTNLYLSMLEDGSIVKVDAITGSVLWTYKWRTLKDGGAGSGPLVISDGSVYFSAGEAPLGSPGIDLSLYALDAQTGALRWHIQPPTRVTYFALAGNGVVYALAEGDGVYALNASDGSVRWHTPIATDIALRMMLANGVLYGIIDVGSVNQWASALFALNAANGALLRQTALPVGKAFGLSAVVNGTLYLFSVEQKYKTAGTLGASGPLLASKPMSDGKPKISYVYAYSQDGKQLWQSQKLDEFLSGLTVADGSVYFIGATTAYALSAKDGTLLWRYQVAKGILYGTSPTVSNGTVYLQSGPNGSDSSVPSFLIALDAKNGAVRWKQPLSITSHLPASPYVLANGLLYVFMEGYPSSTLEAFNPGDGSLAWQKPLEGSFAPGISAAP